MSTGGEDLRGDGVATLQALQALQKIKAELPGVNTILGVSNPPFGDSVGSVERPATGGER